MRKAYTLMELITVMAVMSIIFGISYMPVSSFKRIENKVDYANTSNLIISFINNSKLTSKSRKRSGDIYFDSERNVIEYRIDTKTINKFTLPPGFKITTNFQRNMININSLGYSYDAGTINFTDRENNLHSIKISVGQNYAEIKN